MFKLDFITDKTRTVLEKISEEKFIKEGGYSEKLLRKRLDERRK